MKKILMLIICSLFIFTIACTKKEENQYENNVVKKLNNVNTNVVDEQPSKSYLTSIYEFTNDYTNVLFKDNHNNFVYSPLNVYIYLSVLREASTGETKEEIDKVLNGDDDLKNYIQYLISETNYKNENNIMKISNSLWFGSNYTVNNKFLDLAEKYYYLEAFSTDFSNEAKESMAEWINNNTNNLFNVKADYFKDLNKDSIKYISALYLKSNWQVKFDAQKNKIDKFTNSNGNIVDVTYMNNSGDMLYQNEQDYETLTIPLTSGSVEFILPKENINVSELYNESTLYNILVNKPSKSDLIYTIFSIPKIDLENELNLDDGFKQLGIKSIYSGKNGLNFVDENNSQIKEIEHFARVIFNEDGAEAGSFIVDKTGEAAPPEEFKFINFILNKPFMFIIKSDNQVPLYIGVINNL